MTSSIQQIEAALALAQLAQPASGQPASGRQAFAQKSCSFDLDQNIRCKSESAQAAARLAEVTPPQFCKPLSRIGTGATLPHSDSETHAIALKSASPAPDAVAEPGHELDTHQPEDQSPQAKNCRVRPITESSKPGLPRSKAPKFTSHRNGSNPMLPLNLLQDIGKEVVRWQTQLKRVHDSIQRLYGEGPIVNAWLESASTTSPSSNRSAVSPKDSQVSPSPNGQYHLCGLDQQGQVWRKICPPEQLPQVTVAIARYQRLRQLLAQKKSLDDRLQGLSKALTMLRSGLRAY